MAFDFFKVFTRPTFYEKTAARRIVPRGSDSEHGHVGHHKRAPLPFLASPVDPEALKWVRSKKRSSATGVARARTVAQFDAERSESQLANRIFRKQHEASTLELFFDLFFVANLAVFTTDSSHVDGPSLANYIGFFSILWTTWFHTSIFDVRFYVDSVFTRLTKFLSFGIMVSFVSLTTLYDSILTGEMTRSFQGIALIMFGARLLLTLQYGVVLYFVREFQNTLVPMLLTMFVYVLAALGFLATWIDKHNQTSLDGARGALHVRVWYGVICAEAVAIMVISSIWRILSFKHTHLVERVGLLTLIVMGEGIIGLVKSTSYAIQGTNVTVIEEVGIVTAGVLLIYLIYVLYFDNIDHHRFGTIAQQVWTLLHFPAHVAILLTVEGSTALVIWNACRRAISWITEDRMPLLEDPAAKSTTAAEFLGLLNQTYYDTMKRYHYKKLNEYYPTFTDDLSKLNETKAAYATPEWANEVRPVLQKMKDYYEYFIYQNFAAEGPYYKLKKEKDYGKMVQLYEDGFKFTVMYFYIAAGMLLFVLAFLYWFGRQRKTRTEWTSIGVRIFGGMCLPLMIISPLTEKDDDSFRFSYAYLLIPIVSFALLLVIIVDNIVKAISERHYTLVEEKRMSMATMTMSVSGKGKELFDEDSSYEMHRPRSNETDMERIHGSPELIHVERESDVDESQTAPLTKNAQPTPTVTFGAAKHHPKSYAKVDQDDHEDEEEERAEHEATEGRRS